MNLLGAINYDPAVAVSKATSALLAMTAIDTTNLRQTVTVPAHGMLTFKLLTTVSGSATATPQVLLGVMNGSTVVGRQIANAQANTSNTTWVTLVSEFTISGLAPGSITLDAAYAVQIVVAATNIKYGGPNTNAGNNAWGGFLFEIWDPRPVPITAPGTANGLHIVGTNTGDTLYVGVGAAAMSYSAPAASNFAGMSIQGRGTGAGLDLKGLGSATGGGPGLKVSGVVGNNGVEITGGVATTNVPAGSGVLVTGGAANTGAGATAGVAIKLVGGAGAASTNGAAKAMYIIAGGGITVSGADAICVMGTGDGNAIVYQGAGAGSGLVSTDGGSGIRTALEDLPTVEEILGSFVTGSVTVAQALAHLDADLSSRAPSATAVSNADYTAARAAKIDNLDAAISTRAPALTALSSADYTAARAVKIDNLDAAITTRAPSATAVSNADYTAARAAKIDNLDAAITTRAPSATAVSNADLTPARAAKLDNLDAAISTRAAAATALSSVDYTAARAVKIDNLDATISSRADAATAVSNVDYTGARATKIDNLDDTITSRAPASTALSTIVWSNARASNLDNLDTPLTAAFVAVLNAIAAVPSVDDIWDEIVDGLVSARQSLRILDAVLGGKLSGAGTGTEKIRDPGDTKDRVTATLDASGNRLTIVLDLS